MIQLPEAEVLRALKKFKRLAKQDLLASAHTSDPEFWQRQAEARRAMYDRLMALIEQEGVEAAYRSAIGEHAALPLDHLSGSTPEVKGTRQALELFFTILGLGPDARDDMAVRDRAGDEVTTEASS
ncbi:MAG: hypothetical protein H0Z37_02125 [Firmicutes bacterium]|nr:hypothetical protein [Bacillota bacterium]